MNDLLRRVLRIHPEPVVELPEFNLVLQAEIDPAAYNMLAENEAYALQGRSGFLGDGDPLIWIEKSNTATRFRLTVKELAPKSQNGLHYRRWSFMLLDMRAAWNFLLIGLGIVGVSLPGVGAKSAQKSDAKTLIQSQCARCHSGSQPAGGVDLSGDLASIAGIKSVVPGRPHSSLLFKLVQDGTMPKGSPKLADEDIATIRDWILSVRPDPRPLFAARCISCHGATSPAALLDLSGNLAALAKLPQATFGDKGPTSAALYQRLADGSMPKGGTKLTDGELSSVKDWLNGLHPDPTTLFAAKCVKCHGATTPAAGLDLSGGLDALSGLKQVVKGKPAASSLYQRIADGSMPRGGPALSDSDSGLVWDWIHSLKPKDQ